MAYVSGLARAVVGLGGYLGFRTVLAGDTEATLAQYNDLVKLPPKARPARIATLAAAS